MMLIIVNDLAEQSCHKHTLLFKKNGQHPMVGLGRLFVPRNPFVRRFPSASWNGTTLD